MPLHPTTIRVLPNPYCATDAEGRPAGVCSCDPDLFGRRWIGGSIDPEATAATVEKMTARERRLLEQARVAPRQSARWRFSDEPVEVKFTGDARYFIQKKLRTGELLPADKESAAAAGVPYIDPAKAQAATRAAARACFDAHYGAGAFDALAKERGETTEPEPTAEKPQRSAKTTPKGD